MDFSKMSSETINLFRQIDAKNNTVWYNNAHLETAIIALDEDLANLAKKVGLGNTIRNNDNGKYDASKFKKAYLTAIAEFILIANLQNWTETLNLPDDFSKKLSKLSKDDHNAINTLYLSLKNMLLKSYYEKNKFAFRHAWTLFLKLGIVDFNYDFTEMQNDYLQNTKELLNKIIDK